MSFHWAHRRLDVGAGVGGAVGSPVSLAFGPLPVIAAIWAYQAKRLRGFTQLRDFLADEEG